MNSEFLGLFEKKVFEENKFYNIFRNSIKKAGKLKNIKIIDAF